MALTQEQIKSIEHTIKNSLLNRFKTYDPEPAVMPFHTRLLGKDRLALYAFIHSLNTNFGTTIFEPVAVSLAANQFKIVQSQTKSGTKISSKAQAIIQKIMDELAAASIKPDKQKEIEMIREVCRQGEIRTVKPTRVDVYLESEDKKIYLIDIKTAKPTQTKSGTKISSKAQAIIQKIMDELAAAIIKPDKQKETEIIREVCRQGEIRTVKPTRVDVYLESEDKKIYLIDIKTAKPNKGGFKEFKRTLLEWTAAVLYQDPQAKINTLIAIPYNPYEPKPYSRWTMAGMLDLKRELKVAEEFWGFLGSDGAYGDLLGCFERVGIEMRSEIDEYFSKFN